MSVVLTFDLSRWEGPFDPDTRQRAIGALEAGRVLFFPRLRFALDAADRRVLDQLQAPGRRKNVSFDPRAGRPSARTLSKEDAATLAAVMQRFGDQAERLVRGLAPGYQLGLERARTSFRPSELADRQMPWRADDRRLHVDAFPSRPIHGRRILRLFSNLDPTGQARRWHIGEPFEDHVALPAGCAAAPARVGRSAGPAGPDEGPPQPV